MFSYNVVLDHIDCYNLPFEFDSLDECLDSASAELLSCSCKNYSSFVAFIYLGDQLIKRMEYLSGNVYLVEDC